MNQHRRELNTNELEKLANKVTPFFEKYGSLLIYGACALLIAVSVAIFFLRTSSRSSEAGWRAYLQASTPEEYGKVADKYRDSDIGHLARANEAEMYLSQAQPAMFRDRAGAISDLKKARDSFEQLLKQGRLSPDVEERAQFGLARCLETLCDGDTAQAIAAYEAFLSKFKDSHYAETAKERINALKSEEVQQFYAWFSKQDPKPEDIPSPRDGLPPGHPSVDPGSLLFLPEIPDMLKLPEPTGTAPAFPTLPSDDDSKSSPDAPPLPQDATPKGTAPPLPTDEQP